MKKLWTQAFVLAVLTTLIGCTDDDKASISTCKANTCIDANTLSICANGVEVSQIPCPSGCGDGACSTGCKSTSCMDSSILLVCVNGSVTPTPCPYGCENNTCKTLNQTTCTDGDKKCENNKAYVCSNNSWGDGADCGSNGCSKDTNECNASVTCSDGAKKCENNKAYVCSNNSWGDGADCGSNGCSKDTNECNASVTCSDGAKKCENNKAYVCSNNSWGDGIDCGNNGCSTSTNECNVPAVVICTDGDKKCENNKAYVCSNNSWGDGIDCGNNGCSEVTNECCNDPSACKIPKEGDSCNSAFEQKCYNGSAYYCSNDKIKSLRCTDNQVCAFTPYFKAASCYAESDECSDPNASSTHCVENYGYFYEYKKTCLPADNGKNYLHTLDDERECVSGCTDDHKTCNDDGYKWL